MALQPGSTSRRYTTDGDCAAVDHSSPDAGVLRDVLARQRDDDAHDRGLIVERLAWTPEQRLEANALFLRFYLAVRPSGPLIRDE